MSPLVSYFPAENCRQTAHNSFSRRFTLMLSSKQTGSASFPLKAMKQSKALRIIDHRKQANNFYKTQSLNG
ncbi:hypothetical protein GCWU000325_00369 [Alloprevotella tannerae ATCC 51259]|uniref:Uncharacterized protein n=1 Tax=Alloprevotella tannerae ATCC 51259 TaxID=626522 RepID=C9LDU7_9BACT|nr:hypothetical protein GCWU000325_00369 [Alloprevotella tannerae ATCC 51259]